SHRPTVQQESSSGATHSRYRNDGAPMSGELTSLVGRRVLDTRPLPAADRFDAWVDGVNRSFVPLDACRSTRAAVLSRPPRGSRAD
ncbi:hypothetical protein, partial [Agromyces bauzanensis]